MIKNIVRRAGAALLTCACAAAAWAADGTPAAPAAAAAAAAAASAPAAPARRPLSDFARLPLIEQLVLSPDGQRIAGLMNHGNDTLVFVRELVGDPTLRPILKTDNRSHRFSWLRWASNERLAVSASYASRRGWTELAETRLFSIKRDGSGLVNLVRELPFANGRAAQFQDQVIDWLPEDGQHVLMQLAEDGSASPAVYKVHVETARRVPVHGPRTGVRQWLTDQQHRVRVGVKQDGARIDVLVCDPDGTNWRTAWRYDVFDASAVWPLGFGADPDRLIVAANHENRRAVFEVDLRDPALPRRLLLGHPDVDIWGQLLHDPSTGDAIGIDGALAGSAGDSFWNADTKGLLQAIDRALPDRRNKLLQFDGSGKKYVLHSTGNGEPGRFLVGFRDKGELTPVAETYPELAEADRALPRKQALDLRARDGLPLPSYVTLPAGVPPNRLPTVVLPHGGPISLDSADFDPWVQFLADRGYAVLQVNFRGSAGFGHAHLRSGLKRWGLEMQDDLSDALKWLVDRGTADPARVCIVGGSYGGFAALMGAAKTPDLYRCAVSFAGVSDLIDLGLHRRQFVDAEAVFERQVGDLWDDRAQLKATSPRRLVDQIKAPVLLIHGTADRSVPFDQSADMASALKRAGKAHKFIRQEDGDHHLSHQAHRTQFFQELEAFLDAHIGPAAEASR
jgi:dipeptidyl aminopeptidase/acylaminoacyl peptidase